MEDLTAHYGKRRLVRAERQVQALSTLRSVNDDITVARIVRMFDELGKGLEQEILLAMAGRLQ